MTAGGNFEWQTSAEGQERAVPFVVEWGLTDRLELLVEPVAGTAILPKTGRQARGAGDLEVTGSYLARPETTGFPALAVPVRSSSRPPKTRSSEQARRTTQATLL